MQQPMYLIRRELGSRSRINPASPLRLPSLALSSTPRCASIILLTSNGRHAMPCHAMSCKINPIETGKTHRTRTADTGYQNMLWLGGKCTRRRIRHALGTHKYDMRVSYHGKKQEEKRQPAVSSLKTKDPSEKRCSPTQAIQARTSLGILDG